MRKIKLVSKIVKISLGRDFHLWGVIASEVGRHVLVYWCALPKNVQECNVPSLIHQNRVCYVSVTNNSKVISGKWKVIGTLSEAETGSWPVPCFSATETTSQPEYPGGRYWIVMPVSVPSPTRCSFHRMVAISTRRIIYAMLSEMVGRAGGLWESSGQCRSS
jgi:hypothetical protein